MSIQCVVACILERLCVCVCDRPQRATQVCQHIASNSVASGHRHTLTHFCTHSALSQENAHTHASQFRMSVVQLTLVLSLSHFRSLQDINHLRGVLFLLLAYKEH